MKSGGVLLVLFLFALTYCYALKCYVCNERKNRDCGSSELKVLNTFLVDCENQTSNDSIPETTAEHNSTLENGTTVEPTTVQTQRTTTKKTTTVAAGTSEEKEKGGNDTNNVNPAALYSHNSTISSNSSTKDGFYKYCRKYVVKFADVYEIEGFPKRDLKESIARSCGYQKLSKNKMVRLSFGVSKETYSCSEDGCNDSGRFGPSQMAALTLSLFIILLQLILKPC